MGDRWTFGVTRSRARRDAAGRVATVLLFVASLAGACSSPVPEEVARSVAPALSDDPAAWRLVGGATVSLRFADVDSARLLIVDPAACTECSAGVARLLWAKSRSPTHNLLVLTRPPTQRESRVLRKLGIQPDGVLEVAPQLGSSRMQSFVIKRGRIQRPTPGDTASAGD